MTILAIETSCDETGVAILSGKKTASGFSFVVLGQALLSQAALHAEYGGVYPTLAKREHQKNLPVLLEQVLGQFGKEASPVIDAIAVTEGPGLEPALWTGINFAQKLAKEWNKPLFGVNHMEGHLVSSLAMPQKQHADKPENVDTLFLLENVRFPVLGLLVSGGHTQFAASDEWFAYRILGETLDDAVGEAFDKVARMLGLPYPGGPHISRLAEQARSKETAFSFNISAPEAPGLPKATPFTLPRPMLNRDSCDVSFSGLKTAALYALRDIKKSRSDLDLNPDEKAAFAREFEDAVTDVFLAKTRRALKQTGAQTFVIGGGVAANKHLRESLAAMLTKEFPAIEIRLPDLSITGDNAIMIAEAALLHLLAGDWQLKDGHRELKADGNLSLKGAPL